MRALVVSLLPLLGAALAAGAAETVPTDVQMPGTQPGQLGQIQSVSKCDNCHGNFDPAGEPWFNWTGGMMSHASRDPIFWATVAIAEQDFDGSGDLCLRCHIPEGWLAGRSTPTDGSGMSEGDADGVQCDVCHRLTNPDNSEHLGLQVPPFVANDGGVPDPTGFYGSGMYVLLDESNTKLGPYDDAAATHGFLQSQFHRSSDLCGTCHDVSNPVVGDLAHNNGAQTPLQPGSFSGVPGSPVDGKAAFNNFPYQYGVVERTYSEHVAGALADTLVSDYPNLPLDLQAGAIQKTYQAALLAGNGGDYADGTPRFFTCQSCHMRPTVGEGCNKNPPVRTDLAVHDQTGGNYWMPDVMQYMDALDQLRLGGGLSAAQVNALNAGKLRARQTLSDAASLLVTGNVLRVTNLTGHKLITGYPEGRRMWLEVAWFDDQNQPLVTDGAYGELTVDLDGIPTVVESLLDLHDPYTRVYEIHGGMTQTWANQLLGLGYPASLPLSYDRLTGAVDRTLGALAAEPPGTAYETFHFVLNNTAVKDTRIPPYGMSYDEAAVRNILPVPAAQYGSPGPGGTFLHYDQLVLDPPPFADHATIRLRYQPTSWEYIQFLHLANSGQIAFLADEGANILDAWLNAGPDSGAQASRMAAPHTMATIAWSETVAACADGLDNDGDGQPDLADPGCANAADESEHDPAFACDDRVDNDADGLFDWPADPACLDAQGTFELFDDGDGVADADDNCVFEPNAGQGDADDNGRGDACECGDVTDEGLVTQADADHLRLALAALPGSFNEPRKCNVLGPIDAADANGNGIRDDCDIADAVVLVRAAASAAPGVAQVCAPNFP